MTELATESPISMYEMKEELGKIKKRDGELSIRSQKVEEYINHFVKITPEQGSKLTKKLEDLNIPRLKDIHIAKIIDILPSTLEELRAVLQGYTITVSQDNMKKIVEAVKSVN